MRQHLGATVYIEGRLERGPDEVQVEVTAIQVNPRKSTLGDKAKYQTTAPSSTARCETRTTPAAGIHEGGKSLINPDAIDPNTKAPSQRSKEALPNSLPECEMPSAQFFRSGRLRKVYGDGNAPSTNSCRRDSRKNLNSAGPSLRIDRQRRRGGQASWKFKPATGPNGEPVEVEQTVEVTFQLY